MKLLFAESHLHWFNTTADASAIELLVVCCQLVYFVSTKGPRTVGGVYSYNLTVGSVDVVLKNESNSCSGIKRVAPFKNSGFYRFRSLSG